MSRDFRLQVFFMNQFPPRTWVYHYGHFEFFLKFAEIFAAQGAPPKFEMTLMLFSGAWGKVIYENNWKKNTVPLRSLFKRQQRMWSSYTSYTYLFLLLFWNGLRFVRCIPWMQKPEVPQDLSLISGHHFYVAYFSSQVSHQGWVHSMLPPFGPIEGYKWFFQIFSQWESHKNRFAFISFGKSSFTSRHLRSPVPVVPPQMITSYNSF